MKRWLKWLLLVTLLLVVAGFVVRSVKARKTEQAALSSAANSVPVLDCSNLPMRRRSALVNAPRSWPNNSLSSNASGPAAQSMTS